MGAIDDLRDRIIAHAVDMARDAADLTVDRTKDAASRDTGALVDGISHTEPAFNGTYVVCEIRSEATYSEAQDEGTGIYGPRGARIFPTKGTVLAFKWPGAIRVNVSAKNPEGLSFFRSVAGSPGKHFWREPMPDRWHDALAENLGGN